MIKIKPIVISASAAFVFSFFTALIARSGLPVSLLKAVIFAAVFGGLALGIEFLYGKFLAEGSAQSSVSEGAETQPKVVGGKVDLVVSEEDLPDEGGSPSFLVEGRHVISQDDVGAGAASAGAAQSAASESAGAITAAEQNAALDAAEKVRSEKAAENIVAKGAASSAGGSSGQGAAASSAGQDEQNGQGIQNAKKAAFVPLDLTAKDVQAATVGGSASSSPAQEAAAPSSGEESSSSEAASAAGNSAPHAGQGAASSGGSGGVMDEELDELPDIADLGGNPAAAEEEVIEDSEFAEEGGIKMKRQTELPDGKVADVKDAPIMAEAIRTVLKKEDG